MSLYQFAERPTKLQNDLNSLKPPNPLVKSVQQSEIQRTYKRDSAFHSGHGGLLGYEGFHRLAELSAGFAAK
jgi:hypothetical protein